MVNNWISDIFSINISTQDVENVIKEINFKITLFKIWARHKKYKFGKKYNDVSNKISG